MSRFLVPIALLLAACGGSDARIGTVIRDSAGIRIVENTDPLWREPEAWSLSPNPVVHIGDGRSGEEYELFRVASAARLSDGRIVVANGGSRELRFYGPDGGHVRSVGRRGDGPGEFQDLRWMRRRPGDSLLTYDIRQMRLSVFDSSGAFARSFRLHTTAAVPYAFAVDVFADGSVLATGVSMGEGRMIGLRRDSVSLYHFAADGTYGADVGFVDGGEGYFDPYPYPNGLGFTFYEALFARATYHRPAGNRLYLASSDTYELRRHTTDGVLTDLVRRAHVPTPVAREHVAWEHEHRLSASRSNEHATLTRVLNSMPVPETFPAYDGVAVDVELNVWVRDFPMPGVDRATWSVFDSTGVFLGQLEVPLGLDPEDIGTDYVLGIWRDANDVEHVQLYDLIKPDG